MSHKLKLSQGPVPPARLPTEKERRRGPILSDDSHDWWNYGVTKADLKDPNFRHRYMAYLYRDWDGSPETIMEILNG